MGENGWRRVNRRSCNRRKAKYDALVKGELFDQAKQFRNAAIAHLSITSKPEVPYETFYELHDAAKQLTISLFEVYSGESRIFWLQEALTAHARIFWDTYFDGMHSHENGERRQ